MFHWFEIAVYVVLVIFLGVLILKGVLPSEYFWPLLLGYWAPVSIADLLVGESVRSGVADLLVLCFLIYNVNKEWPPAKV